VWAGCLAPLGALAYWIYLGDLGVNPIDFVTRHLGVWTLRLLLTSLSMTPLRLVFALSWPVTLRRLLGLFACFYASLHFTVWIVVDHVFDWPTMGADILKRPYITVGMTALLLMLPLAATSTTGMVRRLGGRAWRRLHRVVYAVGILAVLHFLWLAKVGRVDPYLYGGWLALVLGIRLGDALRQRVRRLRERRARPRTVPA
jgi:sulfoxide reductase heme-binding subunit YedZ